MKTGRVLLISFILLFMLLVEAMLSCAAEAGTPTLTWVKTVSITTDAEYGSARPEIVRTAGTATVPGRVFVLYLGHILTGGGGRTFDVKIYNSDLSSQISHNVLVAHDATYGDPTDIRIASDGDYLYAFYETATVSNTYLWAKKYALHDDFILTASTATFVSTSSQISSMPDGHDLLNDPAPLIGPNSVFVLTRYDNSLATSGNTLYHVREFNKDTLAKISDFNLDLSAAADGRGRVASLFFWNNKIYMALASTVSNAGIVEQAEDSAASDIVLVKMNSDWTFSVATDVQTISSDQANDRENYITGFKTDGTFIYMTYKQVVPGAPGEQRAVIKMFDMDLNLLHKELVKTATWPGGGEIRPSQEIYGTTIYSGQDNSLSIGTGNGEVHVYTVTGISVNSASPVTMDFGTVASGSTSSPQSLTLTNNGTVDLAIGNVSIFGADASEFSNQYDSCSNQTIVSSGTCTVQAVFSPTSAGLKNACITIPSNDPYSPVLSIPLQGNGGLTLAPDKPSPQVLSDAGTITFTAHASGGTGNYEYKFWLKTAGVWNVVQDYSSTDTWAWNTTGTMAGTYSVQVYIRNAGSSAAYETTKTLSYVLTASSPATGAVLSPDPASPQMIGSNITFTAGAAGGSGTYDYKFWIKTAGTWTTVQDYSPTNTWTWHTAGAAAGTYAVQVYVRNSSSSVKYEAAKTVSYVLVSPPASGATLSPDMTSPQTAGASIAFTAGGIGGSGNYEYRFWLKATGVWTTVQPYSTDNTWTWDTTGLTPGTYRVQVYVRNVGSNAKYDAVLGMGYVIK